MSLFDKFKIQNAAARLIEEQMYEFVVEELQNGIRRNGLWAKALANSQGDESKAKALYISYRVQSLKDESKIAEIILPTETPSKSVLGSLGSFRYWLEKQDPKFKNIPEVEIRSILEFYRAKL